jgi:pimeloyl-ACP methyl ester carboxylesterase
MAGVSTIVLVHGGFVDGSGWEGVYQLLKKDGYRVAVVQHPTRSLTDDVAATTRLVHAQDGPVLLVGHSYGGAVITEAGHDPQVAGLVYIAAFAPDAGESGATLIKDPPPGAAVPPILPPQDGYLSLDKAKFRAAFAADVDDEKAAFMADCQVPWGVEALIEDGRHRGARRGALSAEHAAHEPPDHLRHRTPHGAGGLHHWAQKTPTNPSKRRAHGGNCERRRSSSPASLVGSGRQG